MRRRNLIFSLTLGVILMPLLVFSTQTVTIAPGASDRPAAIEGRCPTFIWTAEPEAAAYELVVYRIHDETAAGDLSQIDPNACDEVLYRLVPGGATAWQPGLDEAFGVGADYLWFVRAVFQLDRGEILDAGEWSAARYFSTRNVVGETEFEAALEVVRHYLTEHPDSEAGLHITATTNVKPDEDRQIPEPVLPHGKAVPKSVSSAGAAIRGSTPDTSGESYGVIGLSASPDGAGLGAANTGGGADLVLDGSADGATDTILRESGLFRNSPVDQTFSLANPDAGNLSLQVEGALTAASLTGDGSGLTGVTADDADTLDGQHGSFFRDASNVNAGTLATDFFSAYSDLGLEGYLDDDDGADLITRDQGDARYATAPLHGSCYGLSVPDFAGTWWIPCTDGDNVWTASRPATCLVHGVLLLECSNGFCNTGDGEFRMGYTSDHNGTPITDGDYGFPVSGHLDENERHTYGRSVILSVEAGYSYTFGCHLSYVTDTMSSVDCRVTWICF